MALHLAPGIFTIWNLHHKVLSDMHWRCLQNLEEHGDNKSSLG